MIRLLIIFLATSQVPPPPSPGIVASPGVAPASNASVEEQKEWLLANLITSLGFDTAKMEQVKTKLDKMSTSQIRILVEVYRTKLQERNEMLATQRQYYEQSLMNQAQLNLDRARAYRDHLKREYDYSIIVKQQEVELMRRATQYQMWALQNTGMFGGGYNPGNWGYGNLYNSYRGYATPRYTPRVFTVPTHIHSHHHR